jgi:hypothetical protein
MKHDGGKRSGPGGKPAEVDVDCPVGDRAEIGEQSAVQLEGLRARLIVPPGAPLVPSDVTLPPPSVIGAVLLLTNPVGLIVSVPSLTNSLMLADP